jgi:hypothetical protein
MTNDKLPKWAQDRLKAEEAMGGPLQTTAPIGLTVWVFVRLVVTLGLWVAGCVLVYLVGRAVVGG